MIFTFLYAIIQPILRVFYRALFFVRISGKENVPKTGGFVLSANHKSAFDPPLLGSFLPRRMQYLAKRELFKYKFSNWFLRGIGAVPISRGGSDIATLKTIISLLKNNGIITVFPQGTRKNKDINDVKSGAVLFAIKSQVPIVPAAIIGDYKFFGGLKVHYGKPIYYTEYYNQKVSQEILHNLSVDLMKHILVMVGEA